MKNLVILIGRVGREPETKDFENGTFVTTFSVATGEKYKDKQSGEMVEKTEWHNIQVWNNVFAKKYIKQGDLISIEGKIETRSWEKESGEKRYTTEIKAMRIDGLAKKGGENGQAPEPKYNDNGDVLPF